MSRLLAVALFATAALSGVINGASISAQAWLANGDFEAGTAGWFVSQGISPDCEPLEGSGAVGVGVLDGVETRLIHELVGPFPVADYTLDGWIRVQSGSAEVQLKLFVIRPGGFVDSTVNVGLPSGPEYAPFQVTAPAPVTPEAIRLVFSVLSQDRAEVCFDNLSLTTPDSPTETPTSSPTSTATQQPPPFTPTTTESPATAVPPTPGATATPTPPAAATFSFTNGGFENGLVGWSKFGGELTTTSGSFAGNAAGLLVSTTDSTKWAYQAVAIDPTAWYEMSAYVQPGAAATYGHLRISWYAAADASGSAIATTDSQGAASTPGYSFLTTGPVRPPPGATSARVRVLLTPDGAGYATLAIDEVSFLSVAAPTMTPTPTLSATPTPRLEPTSTPTTTATKPPDTPAITSATAVPVDSSAAVPFSSGAIAEAVASPSPTAPPNAAESAGTEEVLGVTYVSPDATPFVASAETSGELAAPKSQPVPWAWLLGGSLAVVGLAGVLLQRLGLIR